MLLFADPTYKCRARSGLPKYLVILIYNLLHPVLSGAISASVSDEEVIDKYMVTQDTQYFNVLYDRYSDKVYAKCISMLRDEMMAEDAVQDIFMKVLLSLSKFKQNSRFSTWLYSISYNFCIDVIRRKKKQNMYITDMDDMSNLEGVVDDEDDSDILETNVRQMKVVLEQMKASDKAVLLMKYQDDMSIKDMTYVLDKTESAVKMKIKRAKEKFRMHHKELYTV